MVFYSKTDVSELALAEEVVQDVWNGVVNFTGDVTIIKATSIDIWLIILNILRGSSRVYRVIKELSEWMYVFEEVERTNLVTSRM